MIEVPAGWMCFCVWHHWCGTNGWSSRCWSCPVTSLLQVCWLRAFFTVRFVSSSWQQHKHHSLAATEHLIVSQLSWKALAHLAQLECWKTQIHSLWKVLMIPISSLWCHVGQWSINREGTVDKVSFGWWLPAMLVVDDCQPCWSETHHGVAGDTQALIWLTRMRLTCFVTVHDTPAQQKTTPQCSWVTHNLLIETPCVFHFPMNQTALNRDKHRCSLSCLFIPVKNLLCTMCDNGASTRNWMWARPLMMLDNVRLIDGWWLLLRQQRQDWHWLYKQTVAHDAITHSQTQCRFVIATLCSFQFSYCVLNQPWAGTKQHSPLVALKSSVFA